MRRAAEVSLRARQCGTHACWPAAPPQRQAAGQPQPRCLHSPMYLETAVQLADECTSTRSKGRVSRLKQTSETDSAQAGRRTTCTAPLLHVKHNVQQGLARRASSRAGRRSNTHLPLATQERMLPAAPAQGSCHACRTGQLARCWLCPGRPRGSRLLSVFPRYFYSIFRYAQHDCLSNLRGLDKGQRSKVKGW